MGYTASRYPIDYNDSSDNNFNNLQHTKKYQEEHGKMDKYDKNEAACNDIKSAATGLRLRVLTDVPA